MSNTSRTNWEKVDSLTEEDIDTSDIPPLTEEFFSKSRWWKPVKPLNVLVQVAPDTFALFQTQGEDYEKKMAAALRICVEAHIEQSSKGQKEHKPKLEKLEAELQQLHSERSHFQFQPSTLEDNLQQATVERSHLQFQVSKLTTDLQQLQLERKQLQSQVSKLEANLQKLHLERSLPQANEDTLHE